MNNLLYYPYINLPNTDWAIRALLYYDNISSVFITIEQPKLIRNIRV